MGSAPFLLAPAEGWGPFGPPTALRAAQGAFGPLFIKTNYIFNQNSHFCATLIAISRYLEAKFYYSYFIIFLCYGSKILHKKFQVISSKNEGLTAIFPNFDLILNRENQCH